ncbi:hypothetical protein AAKU55_000486 [Oxalobacteraceae bacterium GrIS 1.11]
MQLDLYVALHYSDVIDSIMHWNIMSTAISLLQAVSAYALDISLLGALQILLGAIVVAALLALFKPLLVGIARAMVLLLKPHLSKEERLARRQMRDAMMLNRMLNAMDGSAPSHAAELRALASRA